MKALQYLFSIFLFLCATILAESDYERFCCETTTVVLSPDQCCRVPCCVFTLEGDYLYWEAIENSLVYGAISPITLDNNNLPSLTIERIQPKFSSGARAALSADFTCSCVEWSITAAWTTFHQHTSNSLSSDVPDSIVVPVLSNGNPIFTSAVDSSWHLAFDTLDLEVGCSISLCKSCSLYPYCGGKGARVYQTWNTTAYNVPLGGGGGGGTVVPTVTAKVTNNFNGGGPLAGLTGVLSFSPLSLFASGAVSVLYGQMNTKNEYDYTLLQSSIQNNMSVLRPVTEFMLGLIYNASCFCDCIQIQYKLAYEAQLWFAKWNATTSLTSVLFVGGQPENLLALQGLVAGLQIQF